MTPTYKTEQAFAILDIKPVSLDRDGLLNAVTEAVKKNMSKAVVNREIPPAQVPDEPARMRLVDPFANSNMGMIMARSGASMKRMVCDNPLLVISANDSSGSQHGNRTEFSLCVVSYKQGYQVNLHATHIEQSGGLSANALGSALAKSIAGNWAQFIPRTFGNVKTAMESFGTVTVVDSYIPTSFAGAFVDQRSVLQAPK